MRSSDLLDDPDLAWYVLVEKMQRTNLWGKFIDVRVKNLSLGVRSPNLDP